MKKVLLFFCMSISIMCNGQEIKRNQWTIQPKVTTSSLALAGILSTLENSAVLLSTEGKNANEYVDFLQSYSFCLPEITWAFPLSSISSDDGAKINKPYWWRELFLWGDYSHTFNFRAGLAFSWKSVVSPFGAYIGADWEYEHLVLSGGSESGGHYSQAIIPNAGLQIRFFGGDFSQDYKPALEIGGSYVHHFKYHNPNDYDLDALNNGFRGKVAAGVNIGERVTFLLQYEHEFYDHFNKDFTPDGVTYPFKDYKTYFGSLSLRTSYTF